MIEYDSDGTLQSLPSLLQVSIQMLPDVAANNSSETTDTEVTPVGPSPDRLNPHITDERCSADSSESSNAEACYIHSVAPDPRRLDPIDNPRIQEEGCLYMTYEKKYYCFKDVNPVFIKRNTTPSEYMINLSGHLVLPYMCMKRLKNEVAAIRYIQSNTTIPTPNIRCAFEDHGRYYIILDLVPGVTLQDLPHDKKAAVISELEGYRAQMHAIKSKVMGGFAGEVIVPHRLGNVVRPLPEDHLKFREADGPEFVLCHNDLGQHNVMVDETTLKIVAILDWEYAGFFPPEFDGRFYLRPGPSAALEGEENDIPKLLDVLKYWRA